MYYGLHDHAYDGDTTFDFGHSHVYSGGTTYNYDTPGHTHNIYGETTYDNGHTHYYQFMTGPAIEVGGGHIHYYEGIALLNHGHIHRMYGYTSLS